MLDVQRATRLHLRLPSASVMSSAVYAKRPTSSQSRDAARAAEDHSKETTTPLLDDDVGAADGAPVPAAPIPVKVIILEPSPSNDFAGLFAPFERQDPVNALLVGVEVGGNHHHGDGSVVNQTSLDNLVQRATRLHLRLPSASVMSSTVYAKRSTSSQSRDAARAVEDHSKETTTPLLDDDVGHSFDGVYNSRSFRAAALEPETMQCAVPLKSPSPTERNPIERIVHLHGNLFRVTLRVPEEENQQRNSSQKERPNTPPLPSVFRLRRKDSQFVYVEGMSNAQRMAMARCVADFTPQTQQKLTLRVPEEENQQRNSSPQKQRPNTPPLPSVFRLRRKDSQFVYVEGMSNAQRMAMARCVADFTPQTQQKQSTEVNSPHQEVLDASTSCRRATGELLIDQVLRPRVRKSKKSTMKRDLSALFSSKDPPKKLVLVCELHLKTSSTFV
ncbi:Hypothetical protein, putative [Bodo saltans]|uniref:Uncharacterized protein n=1 Tax=Bodo saltans TaxID=75058 RepID=A0A0S4KF10_BODSA|nr:Hypothetical protein, putative [Bodo saltans]|eukprot:CUI14257.1 Hypothetical protein, putative [Bodo saltans]